MKDYTLTQLANAIQKSFAQYDKQGTKHWTWQVAAQDLTNQVGSLHKVILQLSGDRWAHNKSKEELEADFRDELTDILAVTLYIAIERGIDMNRAIDDMLMSDQQKVADRT